MIYLPFAVESHFCTHCRKNLSDLASIICDILTGGTDSISMQTHAMCTPIKENAPMYIINGCHAQIQHINKCFLLIHVAPLHYTTNSAVRNLGFGVGFGQRLIRPNICPQNAALTHHLCSLQCRYEGPSHTPWPGRATPEITGSPGPQPTPIRLTSADGTPAFPAESL